VVVVVVVVVVEEAKYNCGEGGGKIKFWRRKCTDQ